jgi:hypothetical protein
VSRASILCFITAACAFALNIEGVPRWLAVIPAALIGITAFIAIKEYRSQA